MQDELRDLDLFEDDIHKLETKYWVTKANLYMIPLKDHGDKSAWQQSRITRGSYLTTAYLAELRSAVRKEQKERWELWHMRISLLIGMIGALIGLVSVLKK